VSALHKLPVSARSVLERGDRDRPGLPADEREGVAAMLLETGMQGGVAFTYMATLIRHRLGVGDRPVPPRELTRQGYAFRLAEERAETIAMHILAGRRKVA
jgi:hypothetical protein